VVLSDLTQYWKLIKQPSLAIEQSALFIKLHPQSMNLIFFICILDLNCLFDLSFYLLSWFDSNFFGVDYFSQGFRLAV